MTDALLTWTRHPYGALTARVPAPAEDVRYYTISGDTLIVLSAGRIVTTHTGSEEFLQEIAEDIERTMS